MRRLLARKRRRDLVAALERVSVVNGAHAFSATVLPDGALVETFSGPNAERFLDGTSSSRWRELIHAEDRERFHETFSYDRLSTLQPAELEYRMVCTDGVTRRVWERLTPRRSRGRLVVDGVALDISPSHARCEELGESLVAVLGDERVHAYLGRITADGSWVEEFAGPGQDQILGVVDGTTTGDADVWMNRIHPDDAPDVSFGALLRLAEGRYDHTYRLIGFDGITRVVRDRGHAMPLPDGSVLMRGIASDVSEQARAEVALATAHAQIEAALVGSRAHLFQAEIDAAGVYTTTYVGPGV